MSKKEFIALLDKYLAGKASYEEEQLLIKAYQTFQDNGEWNADSMGDPDLLEYELLNRFKSSIDKSRKGVRKMTFYRVGWWKVAAAVLIVFSLVLLYRVKRPSGDFYQTVAHENTGNFTEYYNNTAAVKKVKLPDSSYVLLAKGSKIGFVNKFLGVKREVFLDGEGFFEVAKDPSKPFFVYTDKLVAKVLGTSFTIKSGLNNTASVAVRTGCVSVFRREDLAVRQGHGSGVVLTPNQVADLNDRQEIERKVAKDPAVIRGYENTAFHFDATPVVTVFKRLQAAYGIKMVFDEKILATCTISAKMGDENFYQKLSLICHAINATYEVHDGAIVITAAGCAN